MGWNLKQRAQDHIVTVAVGLIVLLLLVVWRAIPSSVWDRVSETTPKRALWALLALEGMAICLLSGALIDYRRKEKNIPARQYYRTYGLFWDEDLNPLCPVDNILLSVSERHTEPITGFAESLKCPKCKAVFKLRFEGGDLTTLMQMQDAIRRRIATALQFQITNYRFKNPEAQISN